MRVGIFHPNEPDFHLSKLCYTADLSQSQRNTKSFWMAHSVAFCFIWSAIFSIIIGDFTIQNRFLPNSYFQSFFVKDWLQCIKACTDVSSCISYNYFSSSKCQLNKYGFQNRCQATQYLQVSQGDVFHQLRPVSLANVP